MDVVSFLREAASIIQATGKVNEDMENSPQIIKLNIKLANLIKSAGNIRDEIACRQHIAAFKALRESSKSKKPIGEVEIAVAQLRSAYEICNSSEIRFKTALIIAICYTLLNEADLRNEYIENFKINHASFSDAIYKDIRYLNQRIYMLSLRNEEMSKEMEEAVKRHVSDIFAMVVKGNILSALRTSGNYINTSLLKKKLKSMEKETKRISNALNIKLSFFNEINKEAQEVLQLLS